MGRVVRLLLLALAVVVLSAAPGRWGGAEDVAGSSSTVVSDPSQQLSSRLPIARSGGAKFFDVDDGGLCDRSDQWTRHVPVAMWPGVVDASRFAICELDGESIEMRVGTIARRASSRGPPRV